MLPPFFIIIKIIAMENLVIKIYTFKDTYELELKTKVNINFFNIIKDIFFKSPRIYKIKIFKKGFFYPFVKPYLIHEIV